MYQKFGKRLFDIIASAFALLILSPLLLWLAWKIKKNLGSPVIFSQIRPGKNNKLFRLYKFRSMTDGRDKDGTHHQFNYDDVKRSLVDIDAVVSHIMTIISKLQ